MRFDIENPEPLIDEPFAARVVDATTGQVFKVKTSFDLGGLPFESAAEFIADESGAVDPRTQPSLGGSYEGVDPFGLWWSADAREGAPAPPTLDPIRVRLEAHSGIDVSRSSIMRLRISPGVSKTDVTDSGLVAQYFRPPGAGPFPGVMAFGGSGGGLLGADTSAALLASRGFAALAIAYFASPGLPDGLRNIPLEYLHTGIRWLLGREDVAGSHIAVLGGSRGGELALLLGATFAEVGAVVARAPSNVVWAGFGPGAGTDSPSWTHRGEPVPWMRERGAHSEVWQEVHSSSPVALTPGFLAELEDEAVVAEAEIAVEQTNGPVLLISGEDDAMWPSARMGELVEKRAADRGFDRVVHLRYPDAGHQCGGPPGIPMMLESVHPVDGHLYAFGGTRRGNAAAQADSWPRTLAFLRDAL